MRRLATFAPGDVYNEKLLLDYQERLTKIGLFEGATVELDATGPPEAAPVTVTVKELSQHQATFGIGFCANTGGRVSLEHYDRKVFGLPWIAHSTVSYGSDLKSIGTELTSYPQEKLWRNLAAGQLRGAASPPTRRATAGRARVGRSKDTTASSGSTTSRPRTPRVNSEPLTTSAEALSANYHWLKRDLDDILAPTGALLGAAGRPRLRPRRESAPTAGKENARGPFVRAYSRFNWYRPFGRWFAQRPPRGRRGVREEPHLGARHAPVPRRRRRLGARLRLPHLGPTRNGTVVGGRVLLTGSVELEHPLTASLPALLGAVFVDAGNAADHWRDLRPVFGYGVGLHYRSPIGPLRVDVAYGHEVKELRLHVSVGVTF